MAPGYTIEEQWSCWFWPVDAQTLKFPPAPACRLGRLRAVLQPVVPRASLPGSHLTYAWSSRAAKKVTCFPTPARREATSPQGPPQASSYPRSSVATVFCIKRRVIPQTCSDASAHAYLSVPFLIMQFLSSKLCLRDTRICAVVATSPFWNNISQASAFPFFFSLTCQFDSSDIH